MNGSGMGRGTEWASVAVGLAALWVATSGAACELPPPRDATKPGMLYRVVEGASFARFDAKAFMHDFAGKTSRVGGSIRVGDSDRLTDAEACIRIDAASLDTGNSSRDGIMRNDHLETQRFPSIDFVLKTVQAAKREAGGLEFLAGGTLSLHGVSREIQLPIRARQDGESVVLVGQVPVKMTDYRIRIPRFLFFTVADQVLVSFELTAKRTQ